MQIKAMCTQHELDQSVRKDIQKNSLTMESIQIEQNWNADNKVYQKIYNNNNCQQHKQTVLIVQTWIDNNLFYQYSLRYWSGNR